MTPKWHFVLRAIILVGVIVITLITSIFLVSFIYFSLKVSGHIFLLGLGARGLRVFILLFPWKTLIFEVFLLFILERLVKNFRIGYERPIIYIVLGLIAFTLVGSFIVERISLHERLLERSERGELPVFGRFYKDVRKPHSEIHFPL